MKYTKDQRLDIGWRIYEGEISQFEAATEYSIGPNTVREYMRLYRTEHNLAEDIADTILAVYRFADVAAARGLWHIPLTNHGFRLCLFPDNIFAHQFVRKLVDFIIIHFRCSLFLRVSACRCVRP